MRIALTRPAGAARLLLAALAAWVVAGSVSGCALAESGPTYHRAPGGSARAPLPGVVAGDGFVDAAMPAPAALTGRLHSPDVAVMASAPLSPADRRRVARTDGVAEVLSLSLASVAVDGRAVTVAAVDPAAFRRFTPGPTARATEVWRRVAEGDSVVTPGLAAATGRRLGQQVSFGAGPGAVAIRLGATAVTAPGVDVVVNHLRGGRLGMVAGNALLVDVRGADPGSVARLLRRRLGPDVTAAVVGAAGRTHGEQTAILTGGSVAAAVGSFRYRYHPDGTVTPDPAWVAAHIRTEEVPLLGAVTCHRVLLPQLRGALQEVAAAGLADSIDPTDFGGCYAPRFIGNDPARGLSLHTWGIAVDLNVHQNLRGTTGAIDRRVVAVFKRWGFAWGGDWAFTDPMHFELAALVRPAGRTGAPAPG